MGIPPAASLVLEESEERQENVEPIRTVAECKFVDARMRLHGFDLTLTLPISLTLASLGGPRCRSDHRAFTLRAQHGSDREASIHPRV